jgi:hypothetical protein
VTYVSVTDIHVLAMNLIVRNQLSRKERTGDWVSWVLGKAAKTGSVAVSNSWYD